MLEDALLPICTASASHAMMVTNALLLLSTRRHIITTAESIVILPSHEPLKILPRRGFIRMEEFEEIEVEGLGHRLEALANEKCSHQIVQVLIGHVPAPRVTNQSNMNASAKDRLAYILAVWVWR